MLDLVLPSTAPVSRASVVFFDDVEVGELWQFIGEGEPTPPPQVVEIAQPDGQVLRYGLIP